MTRHDRLALEHAGPRPRRVVHLDLDARPADLTRDERYESAMVVGWRDGAPVAAVDVILGDASEIAAQQFASLYDVPAPAARTWGTSRPLPSVSVVVCTMVARLDDLRQLLAAFSTLRYDGEVEFILVDNRPVIPEGDVLPGMLVGHPEITVVHQPKVGVSAARNAGMQAAHHEVVAYTDDDVRVDSNWLRVIGERFSRPDDIDALTGMILPAELESPAQFWFERYYGGFSGQRLFAPLLLKSAEGLPGILRGARISVQRPDGHETRRVAVYGIGAFGAGANMAFRRSALLSVGGFDPALGAGTPAEGGEDLAVFIGLLWNGATLAYEPSAVVHHRHRQTFADLERQLHGYGLGFTALITALILDDPRHLLALGWQVPLASWTILRQTVHRVATKSRGGSVAPGAPVSGVSGVSADVTGPPVSVRELALDTGYPRSLVATELRGYPGGPAAYFRSRRWWRTTQAKKSAPEVVRESR